METKIKEKQTVIADPALTAETNNWNSIWNGPPEDDDNQFEEDELDDLDDLEDDEFPIEEDLDSLDFDEEDELGFEEQEDLDFLEAVLH